MFILSSANGHLYRFYFGAIMDRIVLVAMNILVEVLSLRDRHSVLLRAYLGMELLYYKESRAGKVHKRKQHAAITILSRMQNMPRPDLSKSFNLSEL